MYAGVKCMLIYHKTHLSGVSELEAKEKVDCNVYTYFEK